MDNSLYSRMSGYFGPFVNVQKKIAFFPPIIFSLGDFSGKLIPKSLLN